MMLYYIFYFWRVQTYIEDVQHVCVRQALTYQLSYNKWFSLNSEMWKLRRQRLWLNYDGIFCPFRFFYLFIYLILFGFMFLIILCLGSPIKFLDFQFRCRLYFGVCFFVCFFFIASLVHIFIFILFYFHFLLWQTREFMSH